MVYAQIITSIIGLLSFLSFLFNLQIQSIEDYRVLEKDPSLNNMLEIIFTSIDYVGDTYLDKISIITLQIYFSINLFFQNVVNSIVVVK
jgi:hypothetical protein